MRSCATLLFLGLAHALDVHPNNVTTSACLNSSLNKLNEDSFVWDGQDTSLALRTVYRSTSSWMAREALLFDAYNDVPLQNFLQHVTENLSCQQVDDKIQSSITMVREALGEETDGVNRELNNPLGMGGEVVPIGRYIAERQGVCRHRNFLLKIVLEALGISSELSRGTVSGGGRHVWLTFNDTLVLDAMWYAKPVSIDQHIATSVQFDGIPVPLGKCGPMWTEVLQQSDSEHQVCTKPKSEIDPESIAERRLDLQSMRVAALRELLRSYGRECRGCVEKTHFVDEALLIKATDKRVPLNEPSSKTRNGESHISRKNADNVQRQRESGLSAWNWFARTCQRLPSLVWTFLSKSLKTLCDWTVSIFYAVCGILGFISLLELAASAVGYRKRLNRPTDMVPTVEVMGCTRISDVNGKYTICDLRINLRSVYLKKKSSVARPLVAGDVVAIW